MASRILGFVRDIFIAAALGAGPIAEAFLIAFTLPNMFRRFFAEGAFNMAFAPVSCSLRADLTVMVDTIWRSNTGELRFLMSF